MEGKFLIIRHYPAGHFQWVTMYVYEHLPSYSYSLQLVEHETENALREMRRVGDTCHQP